MLRGWGVESQYCQDPREASEAGHLSQDQGKGQPREQARECSRQRSGGCREEEGLWCWKEEVDKACGWSVRTRGGGGGLSTGVRALHVIA